MRIFISYSHVDDELRDKLEIHLASLKRQGVIDIWNDRRIIAGEDVDNEISENLETADIILLLVSADFIASIYCYEIELKRAIERNDLGNARVIPIILRPCDWKELPFGKLLALPKDGKPVTKFPDLDDAFLQITQGIREVANDMKTKHRIVEAEKVDIEIEKEEIKSLEPQRSSNLRVKKSFSDHDRDKFRHDAFEYISNYFENSLGELKTRYNHVTSNFRRVDANHFTAVVYTDGQKASCSTIWLESGPHSLGGIAYTIGESLKDNSYNESLSVEDNGYNLFLKPMGMAFHIGNIRNEEFTLEGAADFYWTMFIEPLQR